MAHQSLRMSCQSLGTENPDVTGVPGPLGTCGLGHLAAGGGG